MAWESFPIADFDLLPLLRCQVGSILLQRPYIALSSHILLILRREITAAAVALFINETHKHYWKCWA